jgi:transposase
MWRSRRPSGEPTPRPALTADRIAPQLSDKSLAEIGTDMTPFPTARHLLSWAGLVPKTHDAAGRRRVRIFP